MPDLGPIYRSRLSQQLIEQPQAFIAQDTVEFSKRLVFAEAAGQFQERHVDLRVFTIQNGNGEVTVFPGGLPGSPSLPGESPTTHQVGHASRVG